MDFPPHLAQAFLLFGSDLASGDASATSMVYKLLFVLDVGPGHIYEALPERGVHFCEGDRRHVDKAASWIRARSTTDSTVTECVLLDPLGIDSHPLA